MQYFLIPLYTIILLFIIGKWRLFKFEGINTQLFQGIFLIKVIAGVGLYLLYTQYYTARQDADIFKYFDDSAVVYNSFWKNPSDFFQMLFGIDCEGEYFRKNYYENTFTWYKVYDNQIFNNNRTMIRLNAVFRFFSTGSYHVHSIFMCFLSTIGITLILKAFKTTISKFKGISVALIFLLPSTLLWTSGVLKGALLVLWLGLLVYSYSRIKERFSIVYLLVILVCFYLIFATKYYVLMAGVPVLLGLIIGLFWKKYHLMHYILAGLICVVAGYFLSSIDSEFNPTDLITGKHDDMLRHAQQENAGSIYNATLFNDKQHETSYTELILGSGKAFFNTLCRPLPGDVSSPLMLVAFLENLLIMLFLLTCIVFASRKANWNMIGGILIFTLFMFVILGWTTPVIGALVRYKVPALPFLILLGFELADKEKLTSKLQRLKQLVK